MYTRFVIIGSYRTGSNYLSSLLANNPHIVSMGELFNESLIYSRPGNSYLQKNIVAKFIRDVAPLWFLQHLIFHSYQPNIQAVGFRFFYLQALEKFLPVLQYLREDTKIRIIHLKRKNLLKSYVSLRMAQETGIWTVSSLSPTTQPALSLTLHPKECESYFNSMETHIKLFDEYFSNHKYIEVTYETLIHKPAKEQRRILTFLGIKPMKLTALTKKLGTIPLRSTITNFSELQHYFQKTKWSQFFDETNI